MYRLKIERIIKSAEKRKKITENNYLFTQNTSIRGMSLCVLLTGIDLSALVSILEFQHWFIQKWNKIEKKKRKQQRNSDAHFISIIIYFCDMLLSAYAVHCSLFHPYANKETNKIPKYVEITEAVFGSFF